MSDNVVISVRNLKTYFYTNERCNKALNGVSMDIKSGKTLCIVGESGCGKSVTATSIMQLLPKLSRIEEGEIIYHSGDERGDIPIHKLDRNSKEMRELRGKDIAMIFQDPMTALNPVYTIGWQITEMMQAHEKISKKDARHSILQLLKDMGIPVPHKRIDQYPHEFSGGQRQRIGIARALCVNPELVICDEAVSALDVSIQAQVLNLLKKLKEERNLTYIFITHDLSVVEYISDRIAVMYLGRIVELSDADELYKHTIHPYTQALLSAIPVADRKQKRERIVLKGDVPSPMNPPSGCHFHGRCSQCQEICKTKVPELKRYEIDGKEHYVACHFAEEIIKNVTKKDI